MLPLHLCLALAVAVYDPNQVPDSLKPWVPWVTYDVPDWQCPAGRDEHSERICTFVATVSVDAKANGGTFEQLVWSQREDLVALIGDARHPPIEVEIDKQRAIVSQKDAGHFVVRVPAGAHKITGKIAWKQMPESLQLPHNAALAALQINGKAQRALSRDDDGRLWLQQNRERDASEDEESQEPEVEIFRRLIDEQPAQLQSRIRLTLSGKSRQLTLTAILPEGWRPVSLESASLPARLLPNGSLLVETRAGKHDITLTAVAIGAVTEAKVPAGLAEDSEEIWVFEPQPRLRLVSVEGVTAVDPKQTELPAEWRKLSAFRLGTKDVLQLVEKQRGQSADDRDRLNLNRSLWLDFDGKGYSTRDQLSGTLSGIRRLETHPVLQLGRVADHGENQLITDHEGKGGVELRARDVSLEIEGRIVGDISKLPIVGYDADMESVAINLQLPPGWKLIATSGIDSARTWMTGWTLLDWFGVALLCLAVRKLFGNLAAVIAGFALILTFTEGDAPRWAWLALIIAEALHQFVKQERAQRYLRFARWAGAIGFALVALPFLAHDVRIALHPQLESTYDSAPGQGFGGMLGGMAPPPAAVMTQEAEPAQDMKEEDEGSNDSEESIAASPKAGASQMKLDSSDLRKMKKAMPNKIAKQQPQRRGNRNLYSAAEQAAVQTGYGMVDWQFRGTRLVLSGPVQRDHEAQLWLLSPWQTSLLRAFRDALLLLTFFVFLRRSLPPSLLPKGLARLAILWVMLSPSMALATEATNWPSAEVLEQLKTRVLAAPPCRESSCAALGQLNLSVQGETLTALLDVSAQAPTLIPIPGHVSQWLPTLVEQDGKPAPRLWVDDDGQLHIAVDKGAYRLRLVGSIEGRDVVSLAMPIPPLAASVSGTGYRLEGLDEDGKPTDSLQLVRSVDATKKAKNPEETATVSALSTYFAVDRHVRVGLQWEVDTTVIRRSPALEPVTFDIDLLPNETLTTPGIRAQNGKVVLGFAPTQDRVTFHSTLTQTPKLVMTMPAQNPVLQTWTIRATVESIWSVQSEGVPNTAQPNGSDLEWHPRPGEQVTLQLSRPRALPGQNLTVEKSEYVVTPGVRETAASLKLQMTSSRGGDHFITLPPGAQLDSVDVDGMRTTVRREGERVALPIHPGQVNVTLTWHEQRSAGLHFAASPVALAVPSVNAKVQIEVPRGRWLLWTSGPRTGPAVLFWSMLVVVIIAGVVIGRLPHSPLTTHQRARRAARCGPRSSWD